MRRTTSRTRATTWSKKFPGGDERALGYVARMGVPLVQVPERGRLWAFPARAGFVSAETWLGKPVGAAGRSTARPALPAGVRARTAKDAQAWLGLGGPRRGVRRASAKLMTNARPGGGKPALRPAGRAPSRRRYARAGRFLPEWDSVIVTRADKRSWPKRIGRACFCPGCASPRSCSSMASPPLRGRSPRRRRRRRCRSRRSGTWTAADPREVESRGPGPAAIRRAGRRVVRL